MPEKKTLEKARRARRQGKSPSTQAGAFVHEEIEHIREGKHGAKSASQAIAIGLSKARRAGIDVPDRRGNGHSEEHATRRTPSRKRSRAGLKALKKEGRSAASHDALSRHAKKAARTRKHR